MLIAIDGNEANIENRVGVNNYAFELLWEIYKLQDIKKPRHKFIIYLSKTPLDDMPRESKFWRYVVLKGRAFWIITKLAPRILFGKEKPDLLFSPSHYTIPIFSIPRVVSIMDLGYLDFSGQFKKFTFWQLKYWTAISIFVSKRIIAISNATKQDIVRHYPFASKKISVIYLGYDVSKYNTKIKDNDVRHIKQKYSIVDDYVLFLSTLKPSKNVEGVVEAFSLLSSKYPKLKLVIAGKKGWMYEAIFEKVKELKLDDRIVFTGFVDDAEKPMLLKGASFLVSPSFTEGFGLHVLESMACGTPVVVSNTGSLPEIAGEAGVYVDPNNINSIRSGMEKILKMNQKSYNQLKEKSINQAKKFSWRQTAAQTLKLLEEVN